MIKRSALFVMVLLALVLTSADAQRPSAKPLIEGRTTKGWKFRNPAAKQTWQVVGVVALDPNDGGRLIGAEDGKSTDGTLLNGGEGKGSDLITEQRFGNCELHVEFLVPKGSNSGVYLMGQYEVQILDSHGKPAGELRYGDCGGIYDTRAPSVNASREPGQWQSFDILFRAPRFDAAGRKTTHARFVSVKLNGVEVQQDVEVARPTTSAMGGPESARGPLMLQGDHGPVAFRNIRIREIP